MPLPLLSAQTFVQNLAEELRTLIFKGTGRQCSSLYLARVLVPSLSYENQLEYHPNCYYSVSLKSVYRYSLVIKQNVVNNGRGKFRNARSSLRHSIELLEELFEFHLIMYTTPKRNH